MLENKTNCEKKKIARGKSAKWIEESLNENWEWFKNDRKWRIILKNIFIFVVFYYHCEILVWL